MKSLIILLISMALLRLDAQTITNYTTANGLVSDFVECIHVDVDDNIWFGTSIGLQKYHPSTLNWANFNSTTYPNMLSNNIKVINGTINAIWIGSDFGINVWNDPGPFFTAHTTSNGLQSNQVKSIDVDGNSTDDIWIGTNMGVSHFDGINWSSYSSPNLHWSGVSATAFDSNGEKWFASPLGGITHFDGIAFTTYDTSNGLLSQNVTDLIIDSQDNKWIGTGAGISVLDASNNSFTHYTQMYLLDPPDTLNPVVDIEIDSYGRIWVAIYVGYLAQGGVAMWDGNQWIDFDISDGLAGPNIKDIAIDSEDNVWVATSTGASKISYTPGSTTNFSKSKINIYPNPTKGKVYVNKLQGANTFSVYNNLGSLVYYKLLANQKKIEADLSSLQKGLYYINLNSDKKQDSYKLFVE